MADRGVFEALKAFQKDHGLPATGTAKPEDDTIKRLNQLSQTEPDGFYIWRTVEDGKVRAAHAQYNRTMRAWSDAPDPGDDFNCRCWAEPLSDSAEARKDAILGKGKANFRLKPDKFPVPDKPWYALDAMSEVNENETIIDEEAKAAGLNPDFIKAIIYVETTQGYYDEYYPLNKSIRPMNVQSEYWKDLGYSRKDLATPRLNIKAGIDLVKRIYLQVPHASASEVATFYHDLGAKRINDYGARVARIMKEKPWLKER
ncbi:MAG: hypothetical protein JNN09_05320 [Alphaproteobacteria bacterium]|nr:hypothetical protein [Alphaproteobacteria bacterium]